MSVQGDMSQLVASSLDSGGVPCCVCIHSEGRPAARECCQQRALCPEAGVQGEGPQRSLTGVTPAASLLE